MPHDVDKVQMIGFEIKTLRVMDQDHDWTWGNIVGTMIMFTNHKRNAVIVRKWRKSDLEKKATN